ncbi:hypothetical protein GJ496_003240 [Pomphorhynchus laevis]|nr:hypothetical protein GJ496_003240 [Pomphorhynchus laevis]
MTVKRNGDPDDGLRKEEILLSDRQKDNHVIQIWEKKAWQCTMNRAPDDMSLKRGNTAYQTYKKDSDVIAI